jgi:lipopolysaccharide transport system ATP-binding protein
MSSEIAISVTNLSKSYQIYHQPHDRLKQTVYPRLQRLLGKPGGKYYREFWALRDVNLEIPKGSTMGIIGRNGSGKSTLLQLICGTLNPTIGSVHTSGRVAALLELGSGFNPEFTGRENVFLNAAVLGLSREETEARFDRIAAFADIGAFIEEPVKTYSTGMYVRLAFAVIAHVDADILVIDEALAVGDAVFTQKCMRFIRNFQEHGTMLFVSHDTSSVQNLCKSAIWLRDGKMERSSRSKDVVEAYLQYTLQEIYGDTVKLKNLATAEPVNGELIAKAEVDKDMPLAIDYQGELTVRDNVTEAKGWNTGAATVVSVSIEPFAKSTQEASMIFRGGERVRLRICATAHKALQSPILGFLVRDRLGQDLFGENTLSFTDGHPTPVPAGATFDGLFEFRLPMLPNGQYVMMASVADGNLHANTQHHWLHDALIINVSSSLVRWGLVGVAFEDVKLEVQHD